MNAPSDYSPVVTNLRPCDHQAFFDALDSTTSPTEALRAAFLRWNEYPAGLHDSEQAND